MKYKAGINIMTRLEILDPQGKVVEQSLHNLGQNAISGVRIGKHIDMNIEASSETDAYSIAENACKKLLANLIMEDYSISITAL